MVSRVVLNLRVSVDHLFVIDPASVGPRDHPPLSKDALPAGWDPD